MAIVLDGTNGITTPDLESAGPVTGTTASFSGNVTLGSSVLATPTGSAPSYACRAWVNFNGTGTVAIRASGNVSSITDIGTGMYGINFTASMPDANYVLGGSAAYSPAGNGFILELDESGTASQARITTNTLTGAAADSAFVNITIHR